MTESPPRRFPRIILIEGLPGSGKTTLAEWICRMLVKSGISTVWFREEQSDHPVMDRALRRSAAVPGYGRRCVEKWQAFISSIREHSHFETFILEGCFFQSTVRFLLEYEHPESEYEFYVVESDAALVHCSTYLIYFTQPDPLTYLQKEIYFRKEPAILSKIIAYTASTPYARSRNLQGPAGLQELYTDYRFLCDRLLGMTHFPILEIDTVQHGLPDVQHRIRQWLTQQASSPR